MKLLIALFVSAFALSANALESHYGQVSYSGGEYKCTYTNNGSAKNMKWVVFAYELPTGDAGTHYVQNKVRKVVGAGETIVAGSGLNAQYRAWYCKFLQTGSSAVVDAPTPY